MKSNIDIDKSLKGGEEFSPPPGGPHSRVPPKTSFYFPRSGSVGNMSFPCSFCLGTTFWGIAVGTIFLEIQNIPLDIPSIMGILLHLGLHIIVANGHGTQPMAGVARMPNTSACAEYNTHRQRHCPWISRPSPRITTLPAWYHLGNPRQRVVKAPWMANVTHMAD